MSAPPQLPPLQCEDTLGLTLNRAGFGMGIVHVVSQGLVVDFFSPGIGSFRLALPVHSGLVIGFVAFERPLARPGIADTGDVLAFFGSCLLYTSPSPRD